MNTTETYLAASVTLLCVAGIALLVSTVRQRIRVRKQWGGRGDGTRLSISAQREPYLWTESRATLKKNLCLTKFMKWIASTAQLGGLLLPVFLGRYAGDTMWP
jgi:hypothetical protein